MSRVEALPWQRELWTGLNEARNNGRLTHALLFAGPEGVGKRHFARALAHGLICEAAGPDGYACGQCRSCLQLASGTHPNLHWIRVDHDEKTGKDKRDISIDQLRDLSAKLALSSHYGGAKVAVIDPADAMNVAGVNALLKTIEEPPPATHLILVSERPMALAATLRSRCQRLRFAVPSEEDALAWLRYEEPKLPAEALQLASGAPLKALAFHRDGLLLQQTQWRRDWLEVWSQKKTPLAAAASVGRDRELASVWLSALVVFLGEVLRLRVAGNASGEIGAIAARISINGLQQLIDEALESQRRLRSNAAPQQVLESLMIAWWRWSMTRPAVSA